MATSSPSSSVLLRALAAVPVLPVLRARTVTGALEVAASLVDAGVTAVEFTTSTDGWADAVAEGRRRWPEVVVGAGTITSEDEARRAVDAGAAFLASPWPVPSVRAVADEAAMTFLEGGFTPSEVAAAAALGPAKVFPAHVGGPEMIASLRAVLPDAVLVPTGGVRLDEVPRWLAAGAYAVGVGSDLARHPQPPEAVAALRRL